MDGEIENDPDFDEIVDFAFTPIENLFVRSVAHQRERLEFEMRRKGWTYKRLVSKCAEICNRPIRDTGQLSKYEAGKCIEVISNSTWSL